MADKKYIRLADLASSKHKKGKLPVSKATIWRWVNENNFPQPLKMGNRVTFWDSLEIDNFISKRNGVVK